MKKNIIIERNGAVSYAGTGTDYLFLFLKFIPLYLLFWNLFSEMAVHLCVPMRFFLETEISGEL